MFYIYQKYVEKNYLTNSKFESWTLKEAVETIEEAQRKALEIAHEDNYSFGEDIFPTPRSVPAWFEPSGEIKALSQIVCKSRPLPHYELDYFVLGKNVGNNQKRWVDHL